MKNESQKSKTVAIGLSGGVDSSVAAWVLKQQGYDVFGIFMINWHDTTGLLEGDCPAEHDLIIAQLVARHLNIPLHVVDFSEQYKKRVVDYMFEGYRRGLTPNPDILCNREIKFDLFIAKAHELGADYIATGHYCRKEIIEVNGKPIYRLLSGVDKNKDQSYFLCQLSQEQLSQTLFPIGELTKTKVREIARKLNLPTADRKDSQGICFVGKVDLPVFLQQKLKPKEGKIIEIAKNFPYPSLPTFCSEAKVNNENNEENLKLWSMAFTYHPENGTMIGLHNGAHFYTIGQRKGLNIGGKTEPLFVLSTDTKENIVYVGQGQNHPGLYRRGLLIKTEDVHWLRPDLKMKEDETRSLLVRIRYRQPLQTAHLFMRKNGLYIIFDKMQRGITPGQFAAWYDHEELIGSGPISNEMS